jgi:hypothetical protein
LLVQFVVGYRGKIDGDAIVVTSPGTDFLLAYRKRPGGPDLT